jgi:hypothetical protein
MSTFLGRFFKIGLEERSERRSQWLRHSIFISEAQKEKELLRQQEMADKQILHLNGYEESDLQSAIAKLTDGSLRCVNFLP